jgi:hypothetical protein
MPYHAIDGRRINEVRKAYKLSVATFALACARTGATIYRMEKKGLISERGLEDLIKIFGTTRNWVLKGEGEMFPNGKLDLEIDRVRKQWPPRNDSPVEVLDLTSR